MPQIKTKFSAGVTDSAGAPSPEFAESSLNWFWFDGTLKKRLGMRPVRALPGMKRTQTGVYHGTIGASTSITAATATHNFETSPTYILVGSSSPFNRVEIEGEEWPFSPTVYDSSARFGQLQYSTGGGNYSTITPGTGNIDHLYVQTSGTDNMIAPGFGVSDAAGIGGVNTIQFCFHEPDDWATETIGGQTKYWIKIKLSEEASLDYATPPTLLNTYVYNESNRILSMIYFTDRNGTNHEFTVSLYGEAGDQLLFHVDGTLLTAADGLVPVTGAAVFSSSTRVHTLYHTQTDRVIGHIEGLGWFYHILKDTNVYQLVADSLGTDYTETQPDGGWEASMPDATSIAVFNSRLFAAKGNEIRWSQPEAFIDLWASRNVSWLDDGAGLIKAMAVFQGSLIIFKERAIYAAQENGLNEGDGYDFVPLSNGVGSIGPVIKTGDALFFVGNDGFYVFDGQKGMKLNSNVDRLFADGELGCDFSKAKGAYNSKYNQLRWFVPRTDGDGLLDAAVYMSASTLVTQGEKQDPIGVYPQGRLAANDRFGFGATCVAEDLTGSVPRVMLGSAYGIIFEMDVGYLDNGTTIDAELVGTEQNYAGSDRFLAGPVFVLQDGTAHQGYVDVTLIPDGDETKGKTIKAYSYEHGRQRSYSNFSYNSTARLSSSAVSKRLNHMVRCHSFAVKIAHSDQGSPEINAVIVETVPIGQRSGGQ